MFNEGQLLQPWTMDHLTNTWSQLDNFYDIRDYVPSSINTSSISRDPSKFLEPNQNEALEAP